MPDLPSAMMKGDRSEDQVFASDEQLYRRVPFVLWDEDDDDVDLDAIELPDMSVVRGKYAHPEWARFDRGEYHELGVIGFRVDAIPDGFLHLGVFTWLFRAVHVPHRRNYPHAEVQAFEDGVHVDGKTRDLDPDAHLRWRELLFRQVKKIYRPREVVDFREDPPDL